MIPLHAALPLSEVLALLERESRRRASQWKSAVLGGSLPAPIVLPTEAQKWSCL